MDIAFIDFIAIMTLFSRLLTIAPIRAAAIAALVICSGLIPLNTGAYSLEGPKWSAGAGPLMQLELGNAGRTLSDGNTSWNVAAAPAIGMWNQVLGNIQLGQVTSNVPVASGDGVNSMIFTSTVFGQSFGAYTLAVTYYRYSGSRMSEADILFNTAQQWDSYRGTLRFGSNGYAIADIQRVVLHELGHAIGLGHPDQAGQNVDAVMNSVISSRYTLSNDDIAGGQALYGAPSASPTPTPTPVPTPTPSPTPKPTPTPTPTPTPKPTPTPTPVPTPTPTPTPSGQPAVSVTASPIIVHTARKATFTIKASVVSAKPVTVSFAMSGSAVLGRNYSLSGTPGQVTIPAGASSATVTLTVLSASVRGSSATMTLSSGSAYTLSSPQSATVTVVQ